MQGIVFVREVLNPETVLQTSTETQYVSGETVTHVVEVARQGPPGPQGPPGSISGFPINIASPQNGDALLFNTGAWTNRPQSDITDGGNF